ncbi:MAG: GDSL-type esterase/lipase family protein [Chitinispirillia bacterium]|jgi:lysophospholipase L1-like esterase
MTEMNKKVKRIIIGTLGDSLTDGHPGYSCYYETGENNRSNYQFWLTRRIKESSGSVSEQEPREIIFINKGICGEITGQIARRLYNDIIYNIQNTYMQNPDFIIIIGGTNDLGWGIDPDKILKNLTDMHTICQNEQITSIGATIPPTRFENDRGYNTQKTKTNQKLRQFFISRNIPFVDLYTGMGTDLNDSNLQPEYDFGDGLHFSVAGYKKMGDLIFEECIQRALEHK